MTEAAPPPATTAPRVFRWHTPGHGGPFLDLSQERLRPFACASPAGLQVDGRDMVLARIRLRKGSGLSGDKKKAKTTTYDFLQLPCKQVLQYNTSLPPGDRHLCTTVLPGVAAHVYFDLDGKPAPALQPLVVRDLFVEQFAACFENTFGREPNLSGMQWETACSADKFSLHCHITTEAFVDVTHHRRWVQEHFLPFLKEQPAARLLFDNDKCLMDTGVYNQHQKFRLFGSSKPGKTSLTALDDTKDADSVLFFRGLINYALPASPGSYLSCEARQGAKSARKGKKAGSAPAAETSALVSEREQDLLRHAHIPWFERHGLPQPVRTSFHRSSTSGRPIARLEARTVCPFLSNRLDTPTPHASNGCYLTLNPTTRAVTFACHDEACKKKRLRCKEVTAASFAGLGLGGTSAEAKAPKSRKRGRGDEDAALPAAKRARTAKGKGAAAAMDVEDEDDEKNIVERMRACQKETKSPIKVQLLQLLLAAHQGQLPTSGESDDHSLLNRAIDLLNNHWFVVTGLPKMLIAEIDPHNRTGLVLRDRTNFQQLYDNWIVPASWLLKSGVPINIATMWLMSNRRREHSQLVYDPSPEPQVEDYNLFQGLAIDRFAADRWAQEHKEEAIQAARPMLEHIRVVWCRRNERLFTYVIKWMALLVQRPWDRPKVSLVLRGEQGAGKGIVMEMLKQIVGARNFVGVHRSEDVVGRFNGVLKRCLLLFVDEAVSPRNQSEAARIKALISEEELHLEDKFAPIMVMRSFLHVVICSNNKDIIRPDRSDRRSACIDVDDLFSGAQTAETKQYFDALAAVPPEAFAKVLLDVDLRDFNPRAVPQTDMLREQKLQAASSVVQWWEECLNLGEVMPLQSWPNSPRGLLKADVYGVYQRWVGAGAKAPNQFWKEMSLMLGSRLEVRKLSNGSSRAPYIVLPSLAACKAAFRAYQRDPEWPFASDIDKPAAPEGAGSGSQSDRE